jgi:predicted DNA binding CopG/RHH family protein
MKDTNINIRLSSEEKERIKREAERNERTISQQVIYMIKKARQQEARA